MRIGVTIVASLVVAATAVPEVNAYDPTYTHRWLTRQAVLHLVEMYPGEYDEVLDHIDDLVAGAHHEDDALLDGDGDPTTSRLMRHFYRPTDLQGLEYGSHGRFDSSLAWGGQQNDTNDYDWKDATDAYRRGELAEAYFALGHIAHLVQDLTVPAHTHLDQHGPPFGDDYEGYVTSMMIDAENSMLAGPPAGTPIPAYESVAVLWQATASASFWRNMYDGDLSDQDQARGTLADMFGDALSFSVFAGNWTIDGVGSLGDDFRENASGYYYFKQLDASPAMDRIGFVASDPQSFEFGGVTEAPMVERMANDLVPVAILASAAAIKMFYDNRPEIEDESEEIDPQPTDDGGCSATSASPNPVPTALLLLVVAALLHTRRRKTRHSIR